MRHEVDQRLWEMGGKSLCLDLHGDFCIGQNSELSTTTWRWNAVIDFTPRNIISYWVAAHFRRLTDNYEIMKKKKFVNRISIRPNLKFFESIKFES